MKASVLRFELREELTAKTVLHTGFNERDDFAFAGSSVQYASCGFSDISDKCYLHH